MYGWRCRIGLLVPSDNHVIEPELWQLAPEGVSIHATRLASMDIEELPRLARAELDTLEQVDADVLAYACNISSFYDGPDADEAIVADLEAEADGTPVTTASTALVEALASLGADSLAVVTPYEAPVNARLETFLTENGFTVAAIDGLGMDATDETDARQISDRPPRDTDRRVREIVDGETVDAVAVTATNLPAQGIIRSIETDIDCPVVSANTAILWHALTISGVRCEIPAGGRLFRES